MVLLDTERKELQFCSSRQDGGTDEGDANGMEIRCDCGKAWCVSLPPMGRGEQIDKMSRNGRQSTDVQEPHTQ